MRHELPALLLAAVLLGSSGCAAEAPARASDGERLQPRFEPDRKHGRKHDREQGRRDGAGRKGTQGGKTPAAARPRDEAGEAVTGPATRSAAAASAPATPTQSSAPPSTEQSGGSGGGSGPTRTATPSPAPTGPPTARVSDPAGDLRGGIERPAYADLTAAVVTRAGSGWEVTLTLAAAPPAAAPRGRTENLATFYDVDRDGQVDYEVWGTLSDDGWSGSHRSPSGARFGARSGVAARASGRTVTLTFPAGHLGGASSFRWSVASEYGTYEQVASGTTARDYAPGSGGAAFPAS